MAKKLKAILTSEKAMVVVNVLFFLSLASRIRGTIFIPYTVWIIYLAYTFKRTSSKAVKIINGIFIAFAVSIIVAACIL